MAVVDSHNTQAVHCIDEHMRHAHRPVRNKLAVAVAVADMLVVADVDQKLEVRLLFLPQLVPLQ